MTAWFRNYWRDLRTLPSDVRDAGGWRGMGRLFAEVFRAIPAYLADKLHRITQADDLCTKCGTDHDGQIPGSLGAEVACIDARMAAITGDDRPSILRSYIDARRNDALARAWQQD